jgi:hypothetical protein
MRARRNHCGRTLGLAVAACLGLPVTCLADVFPNNLLTRIFGIRPLHADADGDRAPPVELRLEEDRQAATHRLLIPEAVLAELAGVAGTGTMRSVVAGVALAAAVGCGFVAYRRGRPARLATVAICGLAAAGSGGFFAARVSADIPPGMPPLSQDEVLRRILEEVGPAGKVIVETAPAGLDEIVLVIGSKAANAE